MNNWEFEQFVLKYGTDILRFCRMITGNIESGDELYQDTMLKMLEKLRKVDNQQSVKSYALSISILLWKNKKKKYARRMKLVPTESIEWMMENGTEIQDNELKNSPEQIVLKENQVEEIQRIVSLLPGQYKIPLYLFYSSNMQINEISRCLNIPVGTVKTRLHKAKKILKKNLEVIGYDG